MAVEADGAEHQLAYVKYLIRAPRVADAELRLVRYKWELFRKLPRHDFVNISNILRPVYMQPHPCQAGTFFHNVFV